MAFWLFDGFQVAQQRQILVSLSVAAIPGGSAHHSVKLYSWTVRVIVLGVQGWVLNNKLVQPQGLLCAFGPMMSHAAAGSCQRTVSPMCGDRTHVEGMRCCDAQAQSIVRPGGKRE